MSAPGRDVAHDATVHETDHVVAPVRATAAPRPHGSLQWPAVVALTAALAFAGLVAAGVFDPMIEAL
ncbi:hypothetical protein ACFVQ3_07885 [Oerskovia sp. NPDC057915]|uniref:hypothetical protein n=1 Tax=Oerskovia sp. NPDC057915 TaxID=3346280 RepID=UPI0036DF3A9E